MEYTNRYNALNTAQKTAVDTIEGPVMVVAGPGTGKTELLGMRVASILKQTDTLPENILCLTYTDSGAVAMRQRLIDIVGEDAYRVPIHTFHSFGSDIIGQHREYFFGGATFTPADDLRRYEIIRDILSELDHTNPLASTRNGEFTYQSDIVSVISELKRSGLTSDELRAILQDNTNDMDVVERLILPLFSGTVKKGLGDQLLPVLEGLKKHADEAPVRYEIIPLIRLVYDSLVEAVTESIQDHPTKPLSAWKKQWLTGSKDTYRLKARKTTDKLMAATYVYSEYLRRMELAGLYDYDDMILQVVHALETHTDLKAEIQERYLYYMVDEFQDTNLAQLRLLHTLIDRPHDDESPNIMVVGDDDQAIYSFQGADINNILQFRQRYPDATVITLTDNYRSTAPILTAARSVIIQGGERLEDMLTEVDKTLTSHKEGTIHPHAIKHPNPLSERAWLADTISTALKKGSDPSQIAIIARKHQELIDLVPHLQQAGIPIRYDRRDNALDSPPILILELLTDVLLALSDGDHQQADSLLPRLLAHPAFGIPAKTLWQLSVDAYDNRRRWMECLSLNPDVVVWHEWLVELAALVPHEALEPLLDRCIGRPSGSEDTPRSPFFAYFFSEKQLAESPEAYLEYLTALSTVRSAVREYSGSTTPTLADFGRFIALRRKLNAPLTITRHIGGGQPAAVSLMSAHAAKGLEFDTVYVLNVTDSMWGHSARSRSRLLGYPENLPLQNAGAHLDERLRLLYVAMTRAKEQLYLSFAETNAAGKQQLIVSFLADTIASDSAPALSVQQEIAATEAEWWTPLVSVDDDLRTILAPRLEAYKLSATHLNHFLDVTKGGPQSFLMENLLHFPRAKSATASYGSAIHAALQQLHGHVVQYGELKPLEDILGDFYATLDAERLSDSDKAYYQQKGNDDLRRFIDAKKNWFSPNQKAELNFSYQGVFVEAAHLSGMIDVSTIDTKAKTIHVTDYKTGKPVQPGSGLSDYEKIKLYKYTQQLYFYKLLVENSKEFHDYTVTGGTIAFIEPNKQDEIISVDISFDEAELSRLRRLIGAVYQKITALDLPDITHYPQTLEGIIAFEDDLLT